jgi:transcriptional regulator with XRE-family HTH domain
MTSDRVEQIATSVEDKAYADAFVEAEIATTVPFQIRAMRKQRGWKQVELARRTNQNQKTISDFENPNYARFTLTSLKKLASAFDVALIVRFVPFSELVDWAASLSAEKINVPARTKDARLKRQRHAKDLAGDTAGTAIGSGAVFAETTPTIIHPDLHLVTQSSPYDTESAA